MLPLISCICITRNRPQLLRNAVSCFKLQSYPNKELILLYEQDDTATAAWLNRTLQDAADVKIIATENKPGQHLGGLRNKAISAASGAYICQWDDDDWYHRERLSYQYNLLAAAAYPACVLGRLLIRDGTTGKTYISGYRHWEGSLLCRKDIALLHPYSNLEKGEDTPVISALLQQNMLLTHNTVTPLYLYCYHGRNTWDYQHFCHFFPYSILLPDAVSALLDPVLKEAENTDPERLLPLEEYFRKTYAYAC